MTEIKEFDNLYYMQSVRNDHLNPLIRRVEKEVVPAIDQLEIEMHDAVKDVTLDIPTKILKIDKKAGGYRNIDLNPIIPVFEGIGVQNITGQGPSTGITLLKFPDAKVTQDSASAVVGFDWQEIFDHNQKYTQAIVEGTAGDLKSLIFTGDPSAVTRNGTNVTLKVPKEAKPLMVSIPGGEPSIVDPVPVTSIELEGETTGSLIQDGKLTLHLNKGGGGGTITNQNFKGFFETLGDLQSQVNDPINGKSFAYVKDSTLGGGYYTAYFYIASGWKELSQDPALTYFAPGAPLNQGVFSIKPSEKIKVDATGQLDLDGLSTPQVPSHFKGFFNSMDELKKEVPKPVIHQDWAYVNNNGSGWLAYRADEKGSAKLWNVFAPLGSFAVVDRKESPSQYRQAFGIYKNDSWEVDEKGILALKSVDTSTEVSISDYAGVVTTGSISKIKLTNAKSMAALGGDSDLLLTHPQRVIDYNATWESGHNTEDYRGNLFYDTTSRTWMGWGDPSAPGGVDVKWTRLLHRNMSDEVKDLVHRLPPKAKSVLPGILGDAKDWTYNGVTFLEKGSQHLPESFRDICGGYVTTSIQDKDVVGVTIPQYRLQTCTADQESGEVFSRRFLATGSPGATISWSPWVRTSFSKKDINAHEEDPAAHKKVIKYHKVTSFTGKCTEIASQNMDNVGFGVIRGGNCDLLVDNYGYTEGADYLEVPYDGKFNIRGEFAFSGYGTASNYPVCTWDVTLVLVRKDYPGTFGLLKKYTYVHTDSTKKYPPIFFVLGGQSLEVGDKLYIKIKCSDETAIKNKHPELYFVPLKSQIVLEDEKTYAGTKIGETYKKHLANLNALGEIEVKAHHNNYTTSSAVRVYGDVVVKTPKEMTST